MTDYKLTLAQRDLYLVHIEELIKDKLYERDFVLEYELRDTFSMTRFEEKFKKYIGE